MTPTETLVLGTRGSRLALTQSESCAEKLRAKGMNVEVRVVRTTSDHLPETPLSVIDRRDVFTRQLDEALLAGEIDLAVHSLKDVPTELPAGIALAAISSRHDPADALVSEDGRPLDGLPDGATVATGSLRRRAQLLHLRPDLRIVEIRGNVETRVRKMREGDADAIVLARAGLERLGLAPEIPHAVLSSKVMLPAVGQGFLAAATLEDHPLRGAVREALNDESGEKAALAERAMLRALEGGCRVPVGAL
ncbi:MAG TPA: hydroxymethylbilane synthase, partial [Rubrobacter sp.]|nr:hydroxymethylbilane synthase [Rubrobacter sp.]